MDHLPACGYSLTPAALFKGAHGHQQAVGHVPVQPGAAQCPGRCRSPSLLRAGRRAETVSLPQEPGRRAELSRILGEMEVAEPRPPSAGKGEDLLALMDGL